VSSLEPHGLVHHAVVRDAAAFEALAGRFGPFLKFKRIQPSLEDVFIRLVEGTAR
jgi:hypothetical protein